MIKVLYKYIYLEINKHSEKIIESIYYLLLDHFCKLQSFNEHNSQLGSRYAFPKY